MPGAGPAPTVPAAAAPVQPPFPGGVKRCGQFGDKPVQVVAGDPGKDRMRQGRTGLLDRHNQQTVWPATISIKLTRRVTSTSHCRSWMGGSDAPAARLPGAVDRLAMAPIEEDRRGSQ